MKTLTIEYLSRAETWLLITTLAYFLMNGAQLFETAVVIPKWTARPPESLSILQGPYRPDLKTFWIAAHSLHEITFIAAIVLCWQIPQARYALLLIFAMHFLVRLWTIGYFAPNIMNFQKTDIHAASADIRSAVSRWRNLNYIRVAAFLALSLAVAAVYLQVKELTVPINKNIKTQIMDQKLSVVTLGVDDLPAQKEFYMRKIGWQPVAENKDIIFFKLNGFLLSLMDRKGLAQGSGVDASGSGFRSFTLSYNVEDKSDVDKFFEKLKASGVKIVKEPGPTPFGGYYFVFADLENNILEIAYNPYIPLDDAGNVITHKKIDHL